MSKSPKAGVFARATGAMKSLIGLSERIEEVNESQALVDGVTVSALLGTSNRPARSRAALYEKYHYMAGDPIISTALRLHVTQALGGHETTGDVVFIEPAAEKQKAPEAKLVEELRADLVPMFNTIAHQICFNGLAFGDAYARIYTKDKIGVTSLYTDEMVYPPLVQAYEQGNQTVGYVVSTGKKFTTKLTLKQMARLRMPRMLYVPQDRVVEKALQVALEEDDEEALPILPAMVGGSLLEAAEDPFDNLMSALSGVIGQRIMSSIDETIVGANMDGMTREQQKTFMESIKRMLLASKARTEEALKKGRPLLERLFHVLPIFKEKQVVSVQQFKGGEAGTITVEDIMLHARRLSGALGIDLSMLGFADQLAGGLGDGGFFRVSAQAAEQSRIIRSALTEFFDHVVDIHTMARYGFVFEKGERPYKVNFYGSISALETERQRTRESAMNGGMALVQALAQLKDIGLPTETNEHILDKVFQMDVETAKIIAKGLEKAKPADDGGGFGGGGFGGGDGNENDNPADKIAADGEEE